MFYNLLKNAFDQIHPLKKAYAQNVLAIWFLFFLSWFITAIYADASVVSNLLWWAPSATFLNLVFMNFSRSYKNATLYFFLAALGGSFALVLPFISSFELLGLRGLWLNIFWLLLGLSIFVSIFTNSKTFNEEFIRRNVEKRRFSFVWSNNSDLNIDANKKYASLNNILRIALLPFAPALGMAISRNFEGEYKAMIMGFLLLFIAVNFIGVYLKPFTLAISISIWQRHNHQIIEIGEI